MKKFTTLIAEGKHDPSIFKAVFLAGGPGSGKTFVTRKLGLAALGFKSINSDTAFENALRKAGLSTTPEDIYSPQGQHLRSRSKMTTAIQQRLALSGRLGLVLGGTGKDFDKIRKQKQQLEAAGYETAMIFVNTNLETAKARNLKRTRSLPDHHVESMWKGAQDNLGEYQRLFRQHFIIVDNSDGSNVNKSLDAAYKQLRNWSKQEVRNPRALEWMNGSK